MIFCSFYGKVSGVRDITVIVLERGLVYASSNPGQVCLNLHCANTLGKCMNLKILLQAIGKNRREVCDFNFGTTTGLREKCYKDKSFSVIMPMYFSSFYWPWFEQEEKWSIIVNVQYVFAQTLYHSGIWHMANISSAISHMEVRPGR